MRVLLLILASFNFLIASLHSPAYAEIQPAEKALAATPTERYLQQYPYDLIGPEVGVEYIAFYATLIEREKEEGFFGYHGCSQKYRIFQDILKAVMEEVFEYQIPHDFQFLRIPGDEQFNLEHNKASFYQRFDRQELSKEKQNAIIHFFFVEQFNKKFGTTITLLDLTAKEKESLWQIFMDYLEKIDTLSISEKWNYDDDYANKGVNLSLSVSQEDKKASKKSVQDMLKKMMKWVDENQDEASELFDKGFQAKIAADILKKTFIRVMTTKKQAFQQSKIEQWSVNQAKINSLLVLTDQFIYSQYDMYVSNYEDSMAWYRYFFPYNDSSYKDQQNLELAMNIPLFGNYFRGDESTTRIFIVDSSIEGGENGVYNLLKGFFSEAGLDPSLVTKLRKIAEDEIKASGRKNGCILQFFDNSLLNGNQEYQGLNENTFVSYDFGIPIKAVAASDVVSGKQSLRTKYIDLQFRLITSNNSTLNPYSFLRVVRHELMDKEIAENILEKMKQKLREGPVDDDKKAQYKAKLDAQWGLS